MFEELKELIKRSYAKYSKYKVAAIIVTKEGHKFGGVNIENASYGASICAERSAFCSAISNGYREFSKLYVMVDSEKIATPCFLCRQVIAEFCNKDMEVICMNNKGISITYKVSDLCPYPFDEDNLR